MGERLGGGLQYDVFVAGPGRVRKIPTSFFQKWSILLRWKYKGPWAIFEKIIQAERIGRASVRKLRNMEPGRELGIFGNPKFLRRYGYEQDRGIPLKDYFNSHDEMSNTRVFDSYISNQYALWRLGIAESTFNFTINNAVNDRGAVFQADLGELVFDKEAVRSWLTAQKWLTQHSFTTLPDGEFKEYVRKRFAELFTAEALDREWGREI